MRRSKKRKLAREQAPKRTDEAALNEGTERKKQRDLVKLKTKTVRRSLSIKDKLQQHDRMFAGLIVELRSMVAHLDQQRELVNVALEALCRCALQAVGAADRVKGVVTEEDVQVLEDFLAEYASEKIEKGQQVAPAGPFVGSVLDAEKLATTGELDPAPEAG